MARIASIVAGGACFVAAVASAKPLIQMPPKGFDVYATDGAGGGWVVHHALGRGDTLWGCGDVAGVDDCTQVFFDAWRTGASMRFLHITRETHDAWFVISVPGASDTLYACSDPEEGPACVAVPLPDMPKLSNVERVWPAPACATACGDDACCGDLLPPDAPGRVVEDGSASDLWVQVGPKVPGPANLYACRDLAGTPTCQLALPNWLAFDREDLGIKRLDDRVTEAPDGSRLYGPGVLVAKLDEDSAAAEAGLEEGMVIVKVGDFQTDRASHARAMLAQHPAGSAIRVVIEGGVTLTLTPRRKSKG